MSLRGTLRVSVWLLALIMCAGMARAQTTGTIEGSVKDPTGAVVPGAKVTATLAGTATARTAATDKNGDYTLPELPVGQYNVTVEATGFKKFEASHVDVTLGHVLIVNAQVELGASAETVTVEANALQVETSSTQLGAVMSDTAIRQLPLNQRNTYQLLQLQPGVQSQLGADLFFGSDNPGVVSVNGGRGRSNNYTVNGGDGNDIFVNAPAIQPTPDAVQEFRVITNTFDAEYGRNSGSVVNVVTKSGSNTLHGDLFEFLRNQALNTKNFFNNTVGDYKQNQFGATLGGPIIKDRTFIFGSYAGDRLIQGISSGAVPLPTAGEAAGDFSGGSTFLGTLFDPTFATTLANRSTGSSGMTCQQAVTAEGGGTIAAGALFSSIFPNNKVPIQCFDPTALALYNAYVAPFGTGTIATQPDKRERDDQFTVRFDHRINSAQQFTGYYYFDDDKHTDPFSFFQAAGANLPGFGSVFTTRTQQWNLSHVWTLSSSSVNEFRFNYFREGQGNLDHPVSILPGGLHTSCITVSPATCFADPANPSAGITTNIPGREGVPFVNTGGFVIGNNFEGELPQTGNTFQWTDNFTKTLGNHTIKFGGDVRRQRFDQFLYFEIGGDYTFISDANLCAPSNPINCDSPFTNDVGFTDTYPNYFIGTPSSYAQGAAQGEDLRNTALYLFGQDSYKIKPNLTVNYGLRWELNTPYLDLGNRLQTFRPGQATTQYPCVLNPASDPSAAFLAATYGSTDCSPNGPANAVFPLGLVFPGDRGVPRGLTSTYYKAFAPRIGIAWSPAWSEGWLKKLTGGPGNSSVRGGYGIFYNPIEQLVLEQFSAEPPFGGSAFVSNPNFNTPFLLQNGSQVPNVFRGVISQTPQTPCFQSGGPNGCVDWAAFRPILLFGEFAPHLRTQYAEQYNLTLERQLSKDMILRIGYVGTQAHHLLASHDLNPGDTQTCLDLNAISTFYANAGNSALATAYSCGPFFSDSPFSLPANSIPAGFTVHLPYGSVPTVSGPNNPAITLVGLRPFSSPLCQPTTGAGCPADGVPVFSNIFAEDTIANSNYNALQISVEKNYSHGLLFQASYTYSKAIDQGASFENELNPMNFRATRGLSLLDARHRFVFSPVWDLPVPQYSGLKGKALDGWQISGILSYQTGFPIRIQTQDDLELESSFFFEDANTPEAAGKVQFANPEVNNGSGNFWFNTANISDPAAGTFGNLPHALCCGPALSNTDLAIDKRTPINERFNTEFRAEFYNAWNHTQFANPDGNFSNSTFGQILKTRVDPRVIQFGLKLVF